MIIASIDWTVKVTDIVMIFAVLIGPLIAVQITEFIRRNEDVKKRKEQIFKNLMSTRSATLTPVHIEALNLVDVEFDSKNKVEAHVLDCWKLYLAHLNDRIYPRETWGARRADLLLDLLHSMSAALGYSYDKAHIKNGTYWPQGYEEAENENIESRKLWLEVLRCKRPLIIQPYQEAIKHQSENT